MLGRPRIEPSTQVIEASYLADGPPGVIRTGPGG